MKKFARSLSLLLALLMLLATLSATLIACNNDPDDPTPPVVDDGGNTSTLPTPGADGKAEYTVNLKNIGGRPLKNIVFYIWKGDDLTAHGETDANGIGRVKLVPANDYTIEFSTSSLEGYNVQERYSFTGATANIVLTSSVIMDSSLAGVSYELGDIMHDFTVTTTEGSKFQLSEALKTHKGVLINFWFSTCSPCINEFPYMQSAYETYSDDIAVIALNNYPTDNDTAVRNFKSTMGLTFDVAKDYSGIGTAFGINAYPTSIFVDRYGTICLIEVGGLTSEKPFVAAFNHFSAANYQQTLFTSISELTPIELPDVEMPSSEEIGAAFNGTNYSGNAFSAVYYPETESSDAAYSWPFLIGQTEGGINCVYPANSFKDSSYATLHATVTLGAGEALAFDWYADTELGVDVLYVLVDGRDIYQISGTSTDWKTCYPYVDLDGGEHTVSFIYLKDSGTDTETDRVLLSNFRIVEMGSIDTATYIPREAATNPNANGLGFQNYITPVFNANDGYYHVGTADGPILLVNLMSSTNLNEESLNLLGYNGDLIDTEGDIYETLVTYCNYAINGTVYGYCPVTEELKGLLERAAEIVGFERENPNQWLQACSYYNAYGTNGEQFGDPVKGVAFFAAFDTVESTNTETLYNYVDYDGRVLMPRGFKYKFVPTRSGAYLIKSQSEEEVKGWIFDSNYEIMHTASVVDRPYDGVALDTDNVSMIVYFEEGKTYYIDIAFYDIYSDGDFTFTVNYLGETYQHFHLGSPGYFTYIESTSGQINETIAGGIDVIYSDPANGGDGYFHELLADGSAGSIIYADFKYSTGMFSHSISKMIELGGFNFSMNETDQMVLAKLEELDGDVDACRAYYVDLWAEEYDYWQEVYHLEEVLVGTYHGGVPFTKIINQMLVKLAELGGDTDACRTYYESLWQTTEATATDRFALDLALSGNYSIGSIDLSSLVEAYTEKMIAASTETPELTGCVAVDAELAILLQALMDKYSFEGVDHSWTKLCYYYKTVGPVTTGE